jgi:hypothetical protein
MREPEEFKPDNSEQLNRIVAEATEKAKAKNARLRHLKERNENLNRSRERRRASYVSQATAACS